MKKALIGCLCASLVFIFLGMSAVLAAIASPSWFVDRYNETSYGLWKRCDSSSVFKERNCRDRKVFMFKEHDFDLDVILSLMCGSALFAIIAVFSGVTMFCFQKTLKSWICCSLLNILFVTISAGSCIAALVYNEFISKYNNKESLRHGWSFIVTCVGAALLFITVILFLCMLCVRPKTNATESIELKIQSSNGRYNKSFQG